MTPEENAEFAKIPCVYRFFQKKEEAEALVSGDVWLSTLKRCRGYEDGRGDPDDGSEFYGHSGSLIGGSDDPDFMKIAERSGFAFGTDTRNASIGYNLRHSTLQDAYVICTTKRFSPELAPTFGNFCVKINKPLEFARRVNDRLKFARRIIGSRFGPIIYSSQLYFGLAEPPGPIGFVKRPDKYEHEQEIRLLTYAKDSSNLAPFLLTVPGVSRLCVSVPVDI